MQQYYGLNIDRMGIDYSHLHAAVLVEQLPPNARIYIAEDPNLLWDTQTWLLWQMEYDLRILAWQNTKDAQKRRNEPKPSKTPKELHEERARAANFDIDLVNSVLGIKGGE